MRWLLSECFLKEWQFLDYPTLLSHKNYQEGPNRERQKIEAEEVVFAGKHFY